VQTKRPQGKGLRQLTSGGFDSAAYARQRRAYDLVAKAMQLEQAGQTAKAEKAYVQGVAAYRRDEPEGVDFALGRLAAFLIAQERDGEARPVLEEAITRGTDLPAVWSDYEWLLLRQKDIERLCSTIAAQAKAAGVPPSPSLAERILVFARRALRDDDSRLAWELADRAFKAAVADSDDEGRWAALGQMGVMHEKASSVDRAIEIWTKAFDEGSKDTTTADRLSLNLERRKDYVAATQVIDTALARGLPANVEERLRKRRERCNTRTSGKKAADVQSYSERHGAGAFTCRFQTRVRPPARDLDIVGRTARCFGLSKGVGAIVDLDLASGEETNRVDGLPGFSYLSMSPTGWAIAIERTGAVGKGATNLYFLEPAGTVQATAAVPDATSEVALGPNMWFVGCRDGGLYAFDLAGKPMWHWEVPGSRGYKDNPYFRPCPYHVAADGGIVVVGSMGDLYALRHDGALLWHTALPVDAPTEHTVWLPFGAPASGADAFRRLGLANGAGDAEIKSAYRRAAKEAHPDLHPGDASAAERFRQAHAAYETLMAGGTTGDVGMRGPGITVSMTISGGTTYASFVRVRGTTTVAGSSNGRVCVYNESGRLIETHILGKYTASPAALHADGSLAAVWSDGMLFFFSGGAPASSAEMESAPSGMLPLADNIVVWRGNNLRVVDRAGATLWEVDFAKQLVAVDVVDDELVCAAGAVMVFGKAVK
jgi:DnaJ domain